MSAIFISYRRHSAVVHARAVYERLLREFGSANVFIDLGGIDIGADFVDQIDRQLNGCRVLLALIDPQWISVTDRHGRRRLELEDDFVRIEIARALVRGVVVVPILLDGAEMPAADQLPTELKALTRRNALALDFHRFDAEAGRLAESIRRLLSTAPPSKPSPEPPPVTPPALQPAPQPAPPAAQAASTRAPTPTSAAAAASLESSPPAGGGPQRRWLMALGGVGALVGTLVLLPGLLDSRREPPPESAAPIPEPVAAPAAAVADAGRPLDAVAPRAASAAGEVATPRVQPATVAALPPAATNPTGRRWILEFGGLSATQACAMVKADPDFAQAQVWRCPNPNRGIEHLPQRDYFNVRFGPTTDRTPLDAIRKTYLAKGVFSVITSPAKRCVDEQPMTCPTNP